VVHPFKLFREHFALMLAKLNQSLSGGGRGRRADNRRGRSRTIAESTLAVDRNLQLVQGRLTYDCANTALRTEASGPNADPGAEHTTATSFAPAHNDQIQELAGTVPSFSRIIPWDVGILATTLFIEGCWKGVRWSK